MKERTIIRSLILIQWTTFWGLSVLDKIIPDVYPFWVGKDFFALFIKFFSSLGLKDPIFATMALASISALEALSFVFYLFATINFAKGKEALSEKWFYSGIISSVILFSLFSIGDQAFGDRFNLLEHSLFWVILLITWIVYKYFAQTEEGEIKFGFSKGFKIAIVLGIFFTTITTLSIFKFSSDTFSNVDSPVKGIEVVEGLYKFDFPFLADKKVWEKTVNTFKENHPDLKVNYIYTGPGELNSKKKTHMLLYLFTEKRSESTL